MAKGYRIDIAVARLFAIVVVVFFHAYGMTYASAHLPADVASMYRDKYEIFNQSYLINIAMPLFTTISGFLFCTQMISGKYVSLRGVVWDKFKRLMIPYFVFTILFMFTTNSVGLAPFYNWNYWHLWYLPMLFWGLVICYLIRNVIFIRGGDWALMILTFAISIINIRMPVIIGLGNIPNYMCWLMLGFVLCRHEAYILNAMAKYHLVWGMIIVYLVISVFYPTPFGEEESLQGQTASLLAVVSLWYIFHLIPWDRYKITKYLLILSSCSFGIYIFHNWIEVYMVSSTAKRLFPIVEFAKAHIYLFPFLFSSVAFAISLGITWLFRKTRIGRFLVG